MNRLQELRERSNFTQHELSERSGISVRSIQRFEAGTPPKGHSLKSLAGALEVSENELKGETTPSGNINYGLVKLINLSSLAGSFLPPANIVLPLIIILAKKQFNPITRQLVSLQILYTLFAFVVFMSSGMLKNLLELNRASMPIIMIFLFLGNVVIILRNAAGLDQQRRLYVRLNFSIL